jgi:hypothetical protein
MNECNDPDHSAINAERQETRGLRRAWIELDDKRQYLEKQLREVTKQRDALAEALASLLSGVKDGWFNEGKWWHTGIEQAEQALAAVKGGSHARD